MKTEALASGTAGDVAVQWFTRRRKGALSAVDERAFSEWLNADAVHLSEYQRIEQAWRVAAAMEDHPSITDLRDRVEQRLEGGRRMRSLCVLAASLAVAALGAVALMRAGALLEIGAQPLQEFRTDVGESTKIKLADGSVITLDTNTILRAKLSIWERRITLERGQASFEVAKDRSRPFIVTASGMSVRATGTAFDVRAETGRFEVTLIEGRVRVQQQGQEHEDDQMANMRPGWRLAVGEDARWRMEPVDLVKETSWHNGTLTFFEEPLDRAAAEMNRYSRRQIVFHGAAPAKSIIGHFRAGDVEGFAEAAELNHVARVTLRTDDRIELVAW